MSNRIIGLTLTTRFPDLINFEHHGKQVRVLGSTAKFVLVIMAGSCDDDGSNACQSISTIQERTGYSRPTVIAAMRGLQQIGLIRSSGVHRFYRTVNYAINISALSQLNDPLAPAPEPEPTPEPAPAPAPENTLDSKAALPSNDDSKADSKADGKATLPYSLTLKQIQEEEEESIPSAPKPETPPAKIPQQNHRPEIYSVYEQNIGPLTPFIAESLGDAVDVHTKIWVEAAIREAVKSGARNWRYISAILRRWQIEGYGSDSRKPGQPQKSQKPPSDNRIRSEADFKRAANNFLNAPEVLDVQ